MDLVDECEAVPPVAGVAFPAGNDDFRAARDRCAQACRRFNDTPEDSPGEVRSSRFLDIIRPARDRSDDANAAITHDMTFRNPTLKAQTPFVKPPFHVDYGLRVRIGGSTFINRGCMIMDTPVADVTVGERCNLGPNCCIVSVGHALLAKERAGKQSSIGKPITIGDDVWIGANVTVLGGVTIGNGAVIGAGSVVTRDVPPATVALGVPARVVMDLTAEGAGETDYTSTVDTLPDAMRLGRHLDRKEDLELARLMGSLSTLQQKKMAQLQQKGAGTQQPDSPSQAQQESGCRQSLFFTPQVVVVTIAGIIACLINLGLVLMNMFVFNRCTIVEGSMSALV